MELADIAPYFFTSVVAIITGYFTYKRTVKAQSEQTEVDRQGQLNETYDKLVGQLRLEVAHREALHIQDREKWDRKEEELRKKIRDLTLEVNLLQGKVDELLLKELEVESEAHRHFNDDLRHVGHHKESQDKEDEDEGSDGAY